MFDNSIPPYLRNDDTITPISKSVVSSIVPPFLEDNRTLLPQLPLSPRRRVFGRRSLVSDIRGLVAFAENIGKLLIYLFAPWGKERDFCCC